MKRLSPYLTKKLHQLHHRKLLDGELILLSRAISDTLPIPPQQKDISIAIHVTTFKRNIDEVIYTLCEYTDIPAIQKEIIYKVIGEFLLWRYKVAYAPPAVIFSGDSSVVFDELSLLPKYVDVSYLCKLVDVLDNANYMYSLFRELAIECNASISQKTD